MFLHPYTELGYRVGRFLSERVVAQQVRPVINVLEFRSLYFRVITLLEACLIRLCFLPNPSIYVNSHGVGELRQVSWRNTKAKTLWSFAKLTVQ